MRKLRAICRLFKEKVLRDPLSPKRVAAGWALGMFVGCTVPFGMQLLVSVPLSFLLKVSKIGATAATFVTNPLTIIFIYPVQIWAGWRVLGMDLSWEHAMEPCERLARVNLLDPEGWRMLSQFSGQVLGGFFAGGLLLALLLTPATYFIVLKTVKQYRNYGRAKRAHRATA